MFLSNGFEAMATNFLKPWLVARRPVSHLGPKGLELGMKKAPPPKGTRPSCKGNYLTDREATQVELRDRLRWLAAGFVDPNPARLPGCSALMGDRLCGTN